MTHVTHESSQQTPAGSAPPRAVQPTSATLPQSPPGTAGTRRTLLLVVGSGRSGTSVFAGLLSRLRFTVPQPEVAVDESNPRGFGEPQWVVDFHTDRLKAARVQVTDARPVAWSYAGQRCYDTKARHTLRSWLRHEFAAADNVLIKDPRLLWFVPLWRQAAEDVGAEVRFVTMLRHPAEVVRSKERWYDAMSNPAHRLAGWVNTALYTERATREHRRAYVLFGDLLDDWTLSVARAGKILGLDVLNQATTQEMRDATAVIDQGLYRSKGDLDGLDAPEDLKALARRVWAELLVLADPEHDDPTSAHHRLDQLREDYIAYYEQTEAVVYSSILAAQRYGMRQGARRAHAYTTGVRRLIRLVPASWRDVIPIGVRRVLLRIVR